jgi:hypothetical protein
MREAYEAPGAAAPPVGLTVEREGEVPVVVDAAKRCYLVTARSGCVGAVANQHFSLLFLVSTATVGNGFPQTIHPILIPQRR